MTGYKQRIKNDEKCKISIQDVDKSARILCQAMANASGLSNGEVISNAILKEAEEYYFPKTVQRILKRAGIEYDID